MSATGDLKNNLLKIQTELRRINYNGPLDLYGLSKGIPTAHLPIIHHTLLSFSPLLASHWAERNYPSLLGKKDVRFIEGVYRILRDEFNYHPRINRVQFFASAFAEQKLIFLNDLIRMCRTLHANLERGRRRTKGEVEEPGGPQNKKSRTSTAASGTGRSGKAKTSTWTSKNATPPRGKPKATTRQGQNLIKVATVDEDYSPEFEMLKRSQQRKSRSPVSRNAAKSPLPFSNPSDTYYHELGSPSPDLLHRRLSRSPTRPPASSHTSPSKYSSYTYPRNPNDSTLHEPALTPPPAPASPPRSSGRHEGLSLSMSVENERSYLCDPGRYSPARSGLMGSPRRGRTYEFGASFARDVTGFRDEIGGGLGSGWRSGTSPERAFGGRPGWGVGNDVVGGVGDSSTPVEYARDEVIRRLERVNEELRGEVVELKERMRGMEAEMRTVVGGLLERVGVLEREMKRVGEERTARGGTVSDEHGGALASRSASGTGTGSTPVSEREEVREGAGGKKKVDVIDHPVMHYTPPPTMSGECTPPEKGLVRDEQVRDDGVEEVVVGEAVRKVGKGDEVGGGHGMSRSEMSDASPEVRAVGVDAGAESDGRNVKKAWEAGGGNEHVEKEMKSGNGDGVAFRRSTGGVGRDEGDQDTTSHPFKTSTRSDSYISSSRSRTHNLPAGMSSTTHPRSPRRALPVEEERDIAALREEGIRPAKAYIQSLEERLRQTSEFLRSKSRVRSSVLV